MKGAYCLIIKMNKNKSIAIGKLGNIHFKKGYYTYVGSAMNNIEKRVDRHLKTDKKLFWHIDYFLADNDAHIVDVKIKESKNKEECFIADNIYGQKILGFGCSDCNCKSHLFYFNTLEKCENAVNNVFEVIK